jgi:hypothetical protein
MTTTPDPHCRKTARPFHWLRTGQDDACHNIASTPLLARQSVPLDPVVSVQAGSPSPLDVSNPRNRASLTRPHTRSAALKSP